MPVWIDCLVNVELRGRFYIKPGKLDTVIIKALRAL